MKKSMKKFKKKKKLIQFWVDKEEATLSNREAKKLFLEGRKIFENAVLNDTAKTILKYDEDLMEVFKKW
jgi:hypothetical protein